MEKNQIVHVVGETIVFCGFVMYYNRKFEKLTTGFLEMIERFKQLEAKQAEMESKFIHVLSSIAAAPRFHPGNTGHPQAVTLQTGQDPFQAGSKQLLPANPGSYSYTPAQLQQIMTMAQQGQSGQQPQQGQPPVQVVNHPLQQGQSGQVQIDPRVAPPPLPPGSPPAVNEPKNTSGQTGSTGQEESEEDLDKEIAEELAHTNRSSILDKPEIEEKKEVEFVTPVRTRRGKPVK
jgi:hypothetical protein